MYPLPAARNLPFVVLRPTTPLASAAKQCAGAAVSATLNGKAIAGVVVDQPPGAKDQDAWTLRSPGLDAPAMTEADTVELCIDIEQGGYDCETIEDLFPRKNYKLALWGKDVGTNIEHDCCPGTVH